MVREHTQGSLGGASGSSGEPYWDNVVPGDRGEEEQGGGIHRADRGGQKVIGGLQAVLVGDAVENKQLCWYLSLETIEEVLIQNETPMQ